MRGGRNLSPVFGEGSLRFIVCFQPARLVGKSFIFDSVAGWSVFWLCHQVLVSDCVIRCCFSSGLWSWLSWLSDQGIVQDGNRPTVECNYGPAGFYSEWLQLTLVPEVRYCGSSRVKAVEVILRHEVRSSI